MTPDYKIIAGSQEITDRIADRLISLALTDNADGKSGTLRITLSNTKRDLIAPERDSILEVHLGYRGARLRNMGKFTVDETKLAGGKGGDVVEVGAKAVSYSTDPEVAKKYAAMQDRTSRSWEAGTTISALVAKIASEVGLEAFTSRTAANVALPHTDQTNESNLALLQRLADSNNAWLNVAYGKIAFVDKRDAALINNATAETTAVTIHRSDVTSYNYANKTRNTYASVQATYHDINAAKTETLTIGSGKPEYSITAAFATREAAQRAADAKFIELMRAGKTFDFTMPAPPALNLVAGGTINAQDFDPQINGPWKTTSVDWSLSKSGLAVSVKCEPIATEAKTEE